MHLARSGPLAAVAALALALTGCGLTGDDGSSIVGKGSLTIGVKADQPGLGFRRNGTFEGFDVDVAKYVAKKLGVAEKNITFVETPSKVREAKLKSGDVDLIFATYSITAKRKTEVTFGGPYYVAHQDTLVRAADEGAVKNVRDLKGRKLCKVTGSNSWRRVAEERKIAAQLVETTTYSDCVKQLTGGTIDAVSTDDLILAGFAAEGGSAVKIINAPISDEKYGVGVKKGDEDGCEAVNEAITKMYQDGTAAALLTKWFGKTSLQTTKTVPQFEGCN